MKYCNLPVPGIEVVSMFKNRRLAIVSAALLALFGACATEDPHEQILRGAAKTFMYEALAQSPVYATTLGYYVHKPAAGDAAGAEVRLDEMLDDLSADGIAKRLALLKEMQATLREKIDRAGKLKGHDFVDYGVLDNYVSRTLFELEKERAHEHNPVLYVELLGTALHTLMVHEYAPAAERYRHLIGRLQKAPAFLEQAKTNLKSSPDVWTQVAIAENEGTIKLVERVIPAGLPAELKSDYDAAAGPALEALRGFSDYLKNDLAKRNQHDWRLGKQLYAEKFQLTLNTRKTPEQALQEAEAAFEATYAKTIEMARPMHRAIYGNQRPPNDLALMREVLEVVADDNRLRSGDQLMGQAKKDIEELRGFVQAAGLVFLPGNDNLQVIETPEFMRGVYSVAGFVGAPALQPKLSAFYWVTPIPPDWPRERQTSKLREYNLFKLKLLTLHEAMPGHYVQTEFANQGFTDPDAEPMSDLSRVLRAAFPDPSYVEGWATYMEEVVVKAGYQSDSNGFQINWMKEQLRVIANLIIDIRMHTMDMSDDQADEMLRARAFQEAEEVRGKILRAKLTSAQLPLYYHGWQEWRRVRDHYQNETTDFIPTSFHDKALRNGAAPLPEIAYITSQIPLAD